jgi:ATP-dependent DNA ligase
VDPRAPVAATAFRMLAANRKGRAELVSRRGNEFGDRFLEIVSALRELPPIVIDCELALLNADGRPDFERLSRRSRLKLQCRLSTPRARRRRVFMPSTYSS